MMSTHHPATPSPSVTSADGTPGNMPDTSGEERTPNNTRELPARGLEVISSLVAIAIATTVIFLARQIEVRTETGGIDPRWWPQLLGFVAVAISIVLLGVTFRRTIPRADLESATREGWIRLTAAVGLTSAFILLWPVLGFLPVACAFIFSCTLLFGARSWKTLVIFPVAMTAFIQLLFGTILRVAL